MTTRLAIVGASGRMGQRIEALALKNPSIEMKMSLNASSTPDALKDVDVVIDFSKPDASMLYLQAAARFGKAYVLGTTGFTTEQSSVFAQTAEKIPLVYSSNMSLGVNVFFKIAQEVVSALPQYKVHIQETHHVHKKDSPSGTALQAGRLIEQKTGMKVTYESFREGEVIGDHRVILTGPSDRLELFHHAQSRDIFAAGAIQAALWVVLQKPGLYTMQDVLGL